MPKAYMLFLALAFTATGYASDSLVCEGKYDRLGQKHGMWACKKGNYVHSREKYHHGVLKTYIIYNDKGQVLETRNRKGRIRKYNPCGC